MSYYHLPRRLAPRLYKYLTLEHFRVSACADGARTILSFTYPSPDKSQEIRYRLHVYKNSCVITAYLPQRILHHQAEATAYTNRFNMKLLNCHFVLDPGTGRVWYISRITCGRAPMHIGLIDGSIYQPARLFSQLIPGLNDIIHGAGKTDCCHQSCGREVF